ncbi:MAG TPA: hypothetical protein VFA23_09890, partial [Dongiaceae bacterium]|nr:hypothetical protein [Dongiaceae bacterium]
MPHASVDDTMTQSVELASPEHVPAPGEQNGKHIAGRGRRPAPELGRRHGLAVGPNRPRARPYPDTIHLAGK